MTTAGSSRPNCRASVVLPEPALPAMKCSVAIANRGTNVCAWSNSTQSNRTRQLWPRGAAFAEQPAKPQARPEPAVVLLQANRLREVGHPVVAGVHTDRERARDVEVDAAPQVATDRGAGVHTREC